jgi:hypothetical protein
VHTNIDEARKVKKKDLQFKMNEIEVKNIGLKNSKLHVLLVGV